MFSCTPRQTLTIRKKTFLNPWISSLKWCKYMYNPTFCECCNDYECTMCNNYVCMCIEIGHNTFIHKLDLLAHLSFTRSLNHLSFCGNSLSTSLLFSFWIVVHGESVPFQGKSWPWQALSVTSGWSNQLASTYDVNRTSIVSQSWYFYVVDGLDFACHAQSAGRSVTPWS